MNIIYRLLLGPEDIPFVRVLDTGIASILEGFLDANSNLCLVPNVWSKLISSITELFQRNFNWPRFAGTLTLLYFSFYKDEYYPLGILNFFSFWAKLFIWFGVINSGSLLKVFPYTNKCIILSKNHIIIDRWENKIKNEALITWNTCKNIPLSSSKQTTIFCVMESN